jgi:hypothetical protein
MSYEFVQNKYTRTREKLRAAWACRKAAKEMTKCQG